MNLESVLLPKVIEHLKIVENDFFEIMQFVEDYQDGKTDLPAGLSIDEGCFDLPDTPIMTIDKVALSGQLADVAGEKLFYEITVDNIGNVTLTGIIVTDPDADAGSIMFVSGDTNMDSKLDVNETWLYSAFHTLTQAEIDSNGGGDGDIDNTATADSNETDPVMDSAVIPLLFNPLMSIDKVAILIDGEEQLADVAGEKPAIPVQNNNT